ncbi:MAG: LPS assembly protein LptD, partial [Acidiferrobacterales bacterium]
PANKQDWYLKANEIDLDQNTFTGTARHATLRFMGVPLFYTPYLSFPLGDHRRSGLLLPEFGSTDSVGSYLSIPYYWNIAPNYDATFTSRLMSRRGVQLQSEFRYLGAQHVGVAEIEVLPNDAVTNGSRLAANLQHRQQFGPYWTARTDIGWVGDTDYFNDFATQLSLTSQSHLPQLVAATYRRNYWKLAMSASGYQTIDATIATADAPFTRLPQVIASWRPPTRNKKLNYEFDANATDFRHVTKESAQRFHIRPSISFPMTTAYGNIVPRISLFSTAYANRTMGTDTAVTVPVISVNGGLTYERRIGSGTRSMVQTLEPKMFLVYAPYVNQSALPLFDTRLPTFSFDSLFQENRFIGSDRIGDTQQFTLALTSRFIGDRSGRERISASIGQTFYLADRQVSAQLPPASTETAGTSNVAAEITAWLSNHWYVRSSVQWDTQTNLPKRNNHFVQYQPAKDRIINIGYRFESGVQELVDISTQWPLSKKWTMVARSQYSLKDNRNQDSYAGLVYNSCCWSLRTMLSRRIDQNSAQTTSVAIQLIFNGLAGFESTSASALPLDQSLFH